MIVSHNEIVTLVNKAFLGMHRETGEADLIANMVAELQMAGLEGIRHFNNASDYILTEQDAPIDILSDGITEHAGAQELLTSTTIVFDVHGSSIACHLPAILDYALERMTDCPHIILDLHNCHNRWLAYGELIKLASKGIACVARWDNGSAPKHTLFVLNQGHSYPELYFFDDNPSSDYRTQDLVIELSLLNFDLPTYHRDDYNHRISSEQIIELHQQAWKSGIYVDDGEWQTLKQTATNILVENSEQSRQGAGGV